jgi:hypothetical protein
VFDNKTPTDLVVEQAVLYQYQSMMLELVEVLLMHPEEQTVLNAVAMVIQDLAQP